MKLFKRAIFLSLAAAFTLGSAAWAQVAKLRSLDGSMVVEGEIVGFDDAVAGLNRYRGELHSWPEGHYAEVFALLTT